ncbi:right-handed parallel beta-helix repeat-containing protein [Termitidicoccus mucosus]|uniref:Uncharacterized protein n=1 Tax=Termitidicoccus mucosus TaxID=1184151 RepID=A0A178ICZ1_9BACT|nr:hypothetical protein AW736_25885 [Opitutaceae bacterium TSB47]
MKTKRVGSWMGAALLGCAAAFGAAPREFFVAPPPAGDDANAGTAAAPFASLERARLAVRARLDEDRRPGAGEADDITVFFRGGRYEFARPVIFRAEDSPQGKNRVAYRAWRDERPVFSGGARVTGWSEEAGGVWRADVGADADFRQLWVNGMRAVRARAPNAGQFITLPNEREEGGDGLDLPRCVPDGLAPRPDETELSVQIAWMHKRLRISRVYSKNGYTRAVINPAEWDAVCAQPQGDRNYKGRRAWLENARAFLDEPGEFFLDRAAGVVFYLPRPGEDMRAAEVIRPVAESLVRLDGPVAAPPRGLVFSGLTFCETGWTRPNRAGFVDVQANSLVPEDIGAARDDQYRHGQKKDRVPGAFHAEAAEDVTVEHCRFERIGGTAVLFVTGQRVTVANNRIADIAGGGIELGNDAFAPKDARMVPADCVIRGNRVSRVGRDYLGAVGILGYYTARSLVAHNEVTDCPYTAISWGWGWGKQADPDDRGGNRIVGNRVRGFLQALDDGGGVYVVGRQPGSEIAGNDIADMLPPDPATAIGGAIYPDQASEGFRIQNNVTRRVAKWLYIWTESITGNRVTNNFSDTIALRNDGKGNVVEYPAMVDGGGDAKLPEAARKIVEAAGPEAAP